MPTHLVVYRAGAALRNCDGRDRRRGLGSAGKRRVEDRLSTCRNPVTPGHRVATRPPRDPFARLLVAATLRAAATILTPDEGRFMNIR